MTPKPKVNYCELVASETERACNELEKIRLYIVQNDICNKELENNDRINTDNILK